MDSLVEQMKAEREMFEKTQEEQKVTREHTIMAAAVHIQTLFRGYRYDSCICFGQHCCYCNNCKSN